MSFSDFFAEKRKCIIHDSANEKRIEVTHPWSATAQQADDDDGQKCKDDQALAAEDKLAKLEIQFRRDKHRNQKTSNWRRCIGQAVA